MNTHTRFFWITTSIVLFALGGYQLGKVTAAPPLVTEDETNTVQVVNTTLKALVMVEAQIPANRRREGDPSEDVGSGFFYKPGVVITNYHVIEGSNKLTVELHDGKQLPATVLSTDIGLDLALLSVKGVGTTATLRLGKSSNLLQGQKTIVLGSPYRTKNFVATGVYATRGRTEAPLDNVGLEIPEMLHTTASVQPGNSGGPMLNSKGDVIGVVDANLGGNEFIPSAAIGLAIPIDVVRESITDLELTGVSQRGSLGIVMTDLAELEPIIRKQAGLPSTQHGAMVEEVPAGSTGARAKLKGSVRGNGGLEMLGDIITAVDGKQVKDHYDVVRLVAAKRPGQTVVLSVVRAKKTMTLKVQLQKRLRGRPN